MASSSSTLSQHDVFLSFRGEDTRHKFMSHLYQHLKDKNIETFKDDEKLKRGEEISPALITAIQGSKISVIIFSKNYAASRWCLDELVKILECRTARGQIVIPVFYDVEPTDVRNQTGDFGKGLDSSLRKKYKIRKGISEYLICCQNSAASESESDKEQIWKNALSEAANLCGFRSFKDGSEATLVYTIVGDVLEKLETGSNNSYNDRGLVGINSRVENIMSLLSMESPEVLMVGIWGMGGIGKTTIAEAVFNKIRGKFESCCFLGNVREKAEKKNGLGRMRDKLISKLLKNQTLEIETPHIGNEYTKGRLRRTKVLVVLDDVDDCLQLEVLIGERGMDQFGQGSRVIVTTRNKQVLNAYDIKHVYDMELLDDQDALKLFIYHALSQNQPIELYVEIPQKIVEYAQGIPLVLKVLGSSLRGRTDPLDWEGELKKLKKVFNMQILEVLKTSYDSLNDEEKEIFLDISCFFKGTDVDRVRKVLHGCCYASSHSGIEALIRKSLIYITPTENWIWNGTTKDSVNVVEMHDLVQEMGWNIVIGESKKAGARSRLWRAHDVCDVLTRKTGTEMIKGILWNRTDINQMNLDPQPFAEIYNLEFLKINSYNSEIEFPRGLESLPEGLRYLEWDEYPLEYLPPTFNPTNLVELHLNDSPLKRLWSGTKDLDSLKFLSLTSCKDLIEIPDLSRAGNLEELNFTANFVLDKIPPSIQHLSSLRRLNLSYCTGLTKISASIQYLKNLTHLNLNYCKSLTEISSDIKHLNSLTHFYMKYCPKITDLPNLSHNLKFLQVDGTLIQVYPSHLSLLTNLVELVVWNFTSFQPSAIFLEQIKLQTPESCKITIKNGLMSVYK